MKKTAFILILLLSVFINTKSFAQEDQDFEQFMGMLSESIKGNLLDELSFQVPWDVRVYAYGYGDFSGDGLDDFVIAIKEKNVTPERTLDVYFLQNTADVTYRLIDKKNYRWVELPVEVAFLCKYGKCFVTNRDNSYWYFNSFRIVEDKLVELEKDVYPIESGVAGN